MIRLASPLWLLLLFVIPLLWWRYRTSLQLQTFRFSSVRVAVRLKPTWAVRFRHFPFYLKMIALVLAIFALARPQSGGRTMERISSGVDIMLAVDTSGSMQALDFELDGKRQNRLQVVKTVVDDFVQKRANDRIGMVVFGTEAYTQCPLTLDHQTLLTLVHQVRIGDAGDTTAIGSALGLSVKRLKDIAAKSKIIILLTDGENNAGQVTPDQAAAAAEALGIKIYTIAAGSRGEVPFPVKDPIWGTERLVYQQVPVDEESLKRIASVTGGQFFRATDTRELAEIYSTIDSLEKTDIKIKEHMQYDERYFGFLIAAMLLFAVGMVLQDTRLRVLP
jgi:Ca-activated chloride channel family protein